MNCGLSHRILAAFGLLLLTTSCAVGPTFRPPTPPSASGYTHEPLPDATQTTGVPGGEAQHFKFGQDLSDQWWTLFGSPELNALVQEATAHYPEIAAQQALLRVAADKVSAAKGVYFPQVDGIANYSREKVSGASIAPGFPGYITSIFQANIQVSYSLDLFGAERRTVEGLEAQAEFQRLQLEASYLTLTSNVAAAVVQLASIQDQIDATHEILGIEDKQLAIIKRRFDLGSQTRADVLQQEANLAAVRATLPALEQQRAVAEHELATLTGRSPQDLAPHNFTLATIRLPQDLPVSLPSALVAQRPDIKAQEARLHEASAAIGVATANLLPQLTLSGSVGDESTRFGNWLFQPGSGIWSAAAGLTQPIFQGGTLRARRQAALATYDAASNQYQLTVLKAFQNVADTLTALANDARALSAQYDSVNAAKSSLDLIQRQYDSGAVNYVSLLTAQQVYQEARIVYVQVLAKRYVDTVTLFQALGGGWWNRTPPTAMRIPAPAECCTHS